MNELSSENEAALAFILSEVVDPDVRARLERKFRAKLLKHQRLGSENREVFNDAYGRAVALGIEDPLDYPLRRAPTLILLGIIGAGASARS